MDSRRRRVLVADDDADMRALITQALQTDGYEVIEARNGREALDCVAGSMLFDEEGRRPDLIILDVRMPGVSGLSLLAGLRSRWATPILLVTAYDVEALRARAQELGADAVFGKPFDMDDLRTAVMNLIYGRKKSGTHAIDVREDIKGRKAR